MGIVDLPSFGSDPATITAPGLDAKVDPLANEFNGNIDNNNIKAGAGIASSKLDLSAIAQVMAMSGKIFKFAKGADVASAAGTITLGDDGNYFDITGTEAITSITAKTAGTFVVLQFDSTASLVDGSNLKLNGNFQGAAEAQIGLMSDGTNWFELGRSIVGGIIPVGNLGTGTPGTGNFLRGDGAWSSIITVPWGIYGTNDFLVVEGATIDTKANTFTVVDPTASRRTTFPNEDVNLGQQVIKGWIKMNGTGTIAIYDSFNVTSITDNGTGDYTITWDIDFASADHSDVGNMNTSGCVVINALATGTSRIITFDLGGSAVDPSILCVHAIGDR